MWAIHAAIQQNTGAVLPLCSVWLHSPLNLIFFFSPVFAFLCLWQRLSLRPTACSGHAAETVMSLPLKEQPHRTAVSDLFSVVWFYFSVVLSVVLSLPAATRSFFPLSFLHCSRQQFQPIFIHVFVFCHLSMSAPLLPHVVRLQRKLRSTT